DYRFILVCISTPLMSDASFEAVTHTNAGRNPGATAEGRKNSRLRRADREVVVVKRRRRKRQAGVRRPRELVEEGLTDNEHEPSEGDGQTRGEANSEEQDGSYPPPNPLDGEEPEGRRYGGHRPFKTGQQLAQLLPSSPVQPRPQVVLLVIPLVAAEPVVDATVVAHGIRPAGARQGAGVLI